MPGTAVINKANAYLNELNMAGIPVEKAFLYGSYARNENRADSDIDLLVVSKSFDKKDDTLRGKAWMLAGKVDVRIEPYLVGLKKFMTDDVSPLLQVVKSEGIEINKT